MSDTPRAQTETAAANLALGLIKEPPIGDLAELDQPVAEACRQWFGVARDELQRREDWNFTSAWVRPAKDATASIGPLKNRYPMPADCLKVREIDEVDDGGWEVQNEIINLAGVDVEQVVLITDEAAPLVRYSKRVANVALWDPQFLIGFAAQLAEYLSAALARSSSTGDKMSALAEQKITAGATADAREGSRGQVSRSTSWTRARNVGSIRGRG